MAAPASGTPRFLAFLAAAVLIVFAALNARDISNQAYSGLDTLNHTVVRTAPGSPAAQAGFQKGDRILTEGGIDVTDSRAMDRQPRPVPGGTREFTIDRAGASQSLTITYAGQPGKQRFLAWFGLLIGFVTILAGLRPYLASAGRAEGLFAAASLCIALAMIGPPYVASYGLRTAMNAVLIPAIFIGLALLVHFLATFPARAAWLDRPAGRWILYGPAVVFSVFVLYLILLTPRSTDALGTVARIFSGIVVAGYFLSALVLMVRQWARATTAERHELGLNVMAGATVIALLPIVLAGIVSLIAPTVRLPGSDFYFVTLLLLPIGISAALMRAQRREEPQAQSTQMA